MNLSDWLAGNECDDERRLIWALNLAELLPAVPDGHMNPERVDVAEPSLELTLNGSDSLLDEYTAPEVLQDEAAPGFASAVFSYALMVDELLRGSSYSLERSWSTEDFLAAARNPEWFEPFEDDPLADVLGTCLGEASKRPQDFFALKEMLLENNEVANYLQNSPRHGWSETADDGGEEISHGIPGQAEQNSQEEKESADDSDSGLAIGIDLGTSNSTVAYYQAGKFKYIEVRDKRAVPSAIYFKDREQGKWLYGERALRRGVMYPDALFKHFKRHIGESRQISFHVEPQGSGTATIQRKYVIDTNIFIKDPRLLEGITAEGDAEILIPKTVYEELERRKSDPKTATEAEVAQNSIDEYRDRIKMEDSHPELLSADMFRSADRNNNDRNDSKILSVALHNDSPGTILLSDDKRVKEKAGWLEKHAFEVWNYDEFSFQRHVREESSDTGELKLTGQEGAAFFLKYLREEIRKEIGYVSKAFITVPLEFNEFQRKEILDAGYMAGFTEVKIRPEPIAAAVAYGLNVEEHKKILVYDFGGGTFDVAVLEIADGDFRRLGAGGDDKLGGEDFTEALIENFIDRLLDGEILPDHAELDMTDEDASGLSHDEFVKNRLKIWEACENIKCRLSTSYEEAIPFQLYVRPGERKDVIYKLTRQEFEDITAELMARAKKALDKALQGANLKRGDIDAIIMAGGTSTIPSITDTVERYFGKKPYADRDPATLIAEGAAIFADIEWNRNSTIDKQIKIFDKTMTDLGVSLRDRTFDVIILANSSLPVQKEKVYSLVKDGQEELLIECFSREADSQASRTMDDSIKYIGQVKISRLPPLKRSEADVHVTFRLTKEYELDIAVNLTDKKGQPIEQANVKIDTIGA